MNTLANQYPVSIVVPIYNVEPFIERCAVSLFEQNFDDIEYIFVDDATPDNSIDVLKQVIKRYPQRANHVKIIHNAENLGLFQTRKIGVMAASGEYIQHIDSDDWVELDMISSMYAMAKKENADVVACDFYIKKSSDANLVYVSSPHSQAPNEMLSLVLSGKSNVNIWNRLMRLSLCVEIYKKLDVNRHINLGEDTLFIFLLFSWLPRVSFLPRGLYCKNQENRWAITASYDKKSVDDGVFVYRFLYGELRFGLNSYHLDLLKQRLLFSCIRLAWLSSDKLDFILVGEMECSIFDLWKSDMIPMVYKVIYSFYFFRMPWLPKALRNLHRRVKESKK